MIGRQVIEVNRPFTLEGLLQFMQEHWDTETFHSFICARVNGMSIEKYIILPATARFITFIYPASGGGLFRRKDRIVLCTGHTTAGMAESLMRSVPSSDNILLGAAKIGSSISEENERKGPAEDALLRYTAYMKDLLEKEGYLL